MASMIYNRQLSNQAVGIADWTGKVVKVSLHTTAYTPVKTHSGSTILAGQVSSTGYTAGGATLASTGKTAVINSTAHYVTLDAIDVTWSSVSLTARYAVLYHSTVASTAGNLIAAIDFGANKTATNGDFTIQWNASGIIRLQAT